ncbi:AAA family ATPase [Shigella flexneri]
MVHQRKRRPLLVTWNARRQIVRFEEITRTPLEVQDCLLGMLSDRRRRCRNSLVKPVSSMREGFNIIATANTRAIAASMKMRAPR